jgi:hypothetical protein
MSSIFESSAQDSRIFSAPPPARYRRPARSWRIVVAAFAAGAACAFLAVRFPAETPKVSPYAPKVAQRADSSNVPSASSAEAGRTVPPEPWG